jgi:hypothetical protein
MRDIRRRQFIGLLASSAATRPLAARAAVGAGVSMRLSFSACPSLHASWSRSRQDMASKYIMSII